MITDRKKLRGKVVVAVVVALGGAVQVVQAQDGSSRPALKVGAASGAIRIDGVLDEGDWTAADSIANLVQIEPVEGQPPTGRTVVRVLVTGDAIVFGIRADDPDAALITRFSRNRDAVLTNEDHVRLVLDTYLDGRSGYVFIINPHGARYDALVARTRVKVKTRSGTRSGKPRPTATAPAGRLRS